MSKRVTLYSLIAFVLIGCHSAEAQSLAMERNVAMLTTITEQSREQFEKGTAELNAGRRTEAKAAFDQSVEIFLNAKLSTVEMPMLRRCYEALIDSIYRLEFPAPGGRLNTDILAAACGWKELSVAAITDRSEVSVRQGFSEQAFESSPLDDLSKLELTGDERESAFTPVARSEYIQLERTATGGL